MGKESSTGETCCVVMEAGVMREIRRSRMVHVAAFGEVGDESCLWFIVGKKSGRRDFGDS